MSKDIVVGGFVWDLEKERINVARHGISFSDARQAFIDPARLVVEDPAHSGLEIRYFCVGKVGKDVATVRFIHRGDKIRMIGAGYWRKWRNTYEKKKADG
jgi:uncharacterized DUF497 family protein